MKMIISRKVTFVNPIIGLEKGTSKAESIINQYVIEGNFEDTQAMYLTILNNLNKEFTQVKVDKR